VILETRTGGCKRNRYVLRRDGRLIGMLRWYCAAGGFDVELFGRRGLVFSRSGMFNPVRVLKDAETGAVFATARASGIRKQRLQLSLSTGQHEAAWPNLRPDPGCEFCGAVVDCSNSTFCTSVVRARTPALFSFEDALMVLLMSISINEERGGV